MSGEISLIVIDRLAPTGIRIGVTPNLGMVGIASKHLKRKLIGTRQNIFANIVLVAISHLSIMKQCLEIFFCISNYVYGVLCALEIFWPQSVTTKIFTLIFFSSIAQNQVRQNKKKLVLTPFGVWYIATYFFQTNLQDIINVSDRWLQIRLERKSTG